MVSMDAFLVSKVNIIQFFDINSYEEIETAKITIPLLDSIEREPNEIISMKSSKCE